jgi:hypothetical protein
VSPAATELPATLKSLVLWSNTSFGISFSDTLTVPPSVKSSIAIVNPPYEKIVE